MKKYIMTQDELNTILVNEDFRPLKVYTKGNIITYDDIYINKYGDIIRPAYTICGRMDCVGTIVRADTLHGKNNAGYILTCVHGHSYTLHKLVASTWCERPEGCTEVDHLVSKDINAAWALEWVTKKENMRRYYANKKSIKE